MTIQDPADRAAEWENPGWSLQGEQELWMRWAKVAEFVFSHLFEL